MEIKGEGKVESIVVGRNELVEDGGSLRAKDSGEREELECGLVLRSVGYTGIPIEGVPFDEKRGLILNDGGRVLDSHDSGHKVVSFEDWQAIDQAEIGRGEPHGRPRVKFVRVEEMLQTLGEQVSG